MTSDAEVQLFQKYGWPIEEEDFGREDEPAIDGCALLEEVDGGLRGRFVVRPGLAADRRTDFAEWVVSRVDRFLEHGPEPDGWQRRSDGAWQLWVRRVEFPSL
ncbi:hypothetical protein [Streptomyces omiyaensis]|uniref:Uncharacterized protein n=1 Tax=Streptomyces omiyaensis TaxID=68247 RepID=A0ABW7BS70_9ACTN